jgi:hypothetical protein
MVYYLSELTKDHQSLYEAYEDAGPTVVPSGEASAEEVINAGMPFPIWAGWS